MLLYLSFLPYIGVYRICKCNVPNKSRILCHNHNSTKSQFHKITIPVPEHTVYKHVQCIIIEWCPINLFSKEVNLALLKISLKLQTIYVLEFMTWMMNWRYVILRARQRILFLRQVILSLVGAFSKTEDVSPIDYSFYS